MARRVNRRGKIEMHKVTPGVKIDNITKQIVCKQNSVAGIKSDDTINRKYVMDTVLENMSNGMTEEDALDIIMKDSIVQKFKYLEANGCNIKECFRNWVRGYKIQKQRQKEK